MCVFFHNGLQVYIIIQHIFGNDHSKSSDIIAILWSIRLSGDWGLHPHCFFLLQGVEDTSAVVGWESVVPNFGIPQSSLLKGRKVSDHNMSLFLATTGSELTVWKSKSVTEISTSKIKSTKSDGTILIRKKGVLDQGNLHAEAYPTMSWYGWLA